jgi:hypothetical protein
MNMLAGNHVTRSLCGLPYATIELFSVRGSCGGYITRLTPAVQYTQSNPRGGGVEYLHGDPASRRRR